MAQPVVVALFCPTLVYIHFGQGKGEDQIKDFTLHSFRRSSVSAAANDGTQA